MIEVIFNVINSTVSKKSIQHDNFMHIFPLSIFQGGGGNCPPCPCLRAPMYTTPARVISSHSHVFSCGSGRPTTASSHCSAIVNISALPLASWLRTTTITSSPRSVSCCFGVMTTALWSDRPMFGKTIQETGVDLVEDDDPRVGDLTTCRKGYDSSAASRS